MTSPLPDARARIVHGSGPGLLLAHGAGGGIEANYGPIMEGLAARHTVVGVDYPGSGKNPTTSTPLELDVLADQLVAAADDEGLDTFAVCGYSLGGPVAIRVAARHPERVTSLVLTATFARPDTRTDLAAAVWHQLYESGQHVLLAQYLTRLTLGAPVLNSLTPAQVRAAAEQTALALPPGTGAQVDLVRRVDVRADLAPITVPTLVVVTTEDPLIPAALQHQLAEAVPGATTAALATGHLPFLERPKEWLEIITGFLGRQQDRH
ncbi:alpha/beta fold hydrolase [Streptomyces sp. NPDC048664]|uniref:alpha/beta fold hydrolase n=1 Tax=Streptomyces sp. NPDC048664 TaxID=3154505 RepID=UPI003436E361